MNKLKQIRQQQGLSSQGLAVKAKLSTATVTAVEKWDYVPTPPTCARMAQALGVDTRDIWPVETTPSNGGLEVSLEPI